MESNIGIRLSEASVAIVGAGAVGMSYAYALLNQGLCGSIRLIDIDTRRAEAEANDLAHGIVFSAAQPDIRACGYDEAAKCSIMAIAAGFPQKQGEDRLSLSDANGKVIADVVGRAEEAGFRGIYLVATNPVDVMTMRVIIESRREKRSGSVIGTGTALDSARLRYMLGEYFGVSSKSVHAFVMGEHGEGSFIPWTQAYIATKRVTDIVEDNPALYGFEYLASLDERVRAAAADIIAAKSATCYGVGMAMAAITRAVLRDERSIMPVSTLMEGEYGQRGVCLGVPAVIDASGVRERVKLALNSYEHGELDRAARKLLGYVGAGGRY